MCREERKRGGRELVKGKRKIEERKLNKGLEGTNPVRIEVR